MQKRLNQREAVGDAWISYLIQSGCPRAGVGAEARVGRNTSHYAVHPHNNNKPTS